MAGIHTTVVLKEEPAHAWKEADSSAEGIRSEHMVLRKGGERGANGS